MKKLIAFAVLTLATLQGYSQSIFGTVTDATTNKPLASANITVYPGSLSAVTNANGEYQIKVPKVGNYLVEVSFIGYLQGQFQVYVSEEKTKLDVDLLEGKELLEPVNISAIRAANNVPIAKSNLDKEAIESRNEGRDIPFILKDLPNTVVTSDAGAGVGYTGIRIRGSDISRINVTVNGISINDPESHGVFWVNTPDLASSTNSVQVQRGVGTSTNGPGAFGASINLKTSGLNSTPYAAADLTGGSFNTLKTNLQVGSGLLNNHWVVEGRFSRITSDGFIDRANSNLQSYYLSGGYYSKNTSVQLIHFGGGEETYQAWWGIPEEKLRGTEAELANHILVNGYDSQDSANIVDSDNRTYNYYTYDNEVDNYKQDHYQLHLSHKFSNRLTANAALHYTYGRGYFEQYRKDDDLADYGLPSVIMGGDTLGSSDLIRRRWLDNNFYGATYSLEYNSSFINATLGGAYNQYDGDHFGEIIWARFTGEGEIRDRYYDNTTEKTDFNTFLKLNKTFNKLSIFADLQYRRVSYKAEGIDNDRRAFTIDKQFNFFNPKAGINYSLKDNQRVYASVGVAQREPVRNDFLDAIAGTEPKSEHLTDYELGYELSDTKTFFSANFFYMDYQDQLVLTGQVNDVGSAIRTNVSESYRAGLELLARRSLNKWFSAGLNAALSRNIIKNFTDYIADYDNGGYQTTTESSRDISFSPNFIGGVELNAMPFKGFTATLNTKYVSRQFLDNTGQSDWFDFTSTNGKVLDAYTVTDLRLNYILPVNFAKELKVHLLVANIFNEEYEPNGYTYSYIFGETVTQNFYFPMAGVNILAGIKIRF